MSEIGKIYTDGDLIVRQGDPAEHMYVVQEGQVEVVCQLGDGSTSMAILGPGDVFGEMAIFERGPRSATVRAKGQARVLSVDKKGFLRRVHEDPSLAYRILQQMSRRIRDLDAEVTKLRHEPHHG